MFRGRYGNRGGGSSSRGRGGSNGAYASRLRGLFADGIWQCDCGPRLPAEHFKVKKEGANKGRWFYTCQNQEPKRCGFFLWDEDAKPREEAAVLSNSRTEPGGRNVAGDKQEGWNAGRQPAASPAGKGLFAETGRHSYPDDPDETDSPTPSPPPPYRSPSKAPPSSGTKRNAQAADMDDEDDESFPWPLTGQEEQDLAKVADGAAAPETPHKAQKTGVYATPATTGKRKLPWLEQPSTPAPSSAKPTSDHFHTPTRTSAFLAPIKEEQTLETPKAPPTLTTAKSPSPPSRYKDALTNPADASSSLTGEALAALSSANIPPDVLSNLRSILSKHDLKNQGITRGRDISRLALKARDAKIVELQMRIESLQADAELDRGVIRQLRWQAEHGQRSEGEGP
ncbi:hypothetical protein LTR36_002606 [Oleoguttula mirabilis]|uniref:GRF-type domain-containing protein n=1 Tax=Oleoguttula mirabilis TaxID=1507867 RepID=A0AAV9JJP1_9PEZI|nr:hypothetical protein LTR36_002606 [Oleoguttula mirabilis]